MSFEFPTLNSRRSAGFTLLEVLVALAILGIALLTIVQIFSAGLKGIAVSGDYVAAAARAEAKMREVLDEETLTEKTWSETTEDGYRLDAAITEALKERTDNLQVKLMEIAVTVHWKKGAHDKAFTLKTLKTIARKI